MNEIHEANRRGWDAASPRWQSEIDATKNWRNYSLEPGLALNAQELKALKEISGKEACVLGSGDNLVVFALSGLGAHVTSVDISQTQLDIAAQRSEELELDVTFMCLGKRTLAGTTRKFADDRKKRVDGSTNTVSSPICQEPGTKKENPHAL